jgi:hypothetical protein
LSDGDVVRVLGIADIERAFDLDEQFRYVDHVFDRVFAAAEPAVAAVPVDSLGALP